MFEPAIFAGTPQPKPLSPARIAAYSREDERARAKAVRTAIAAEAKRGGVFHAGPPDPERDPGLGAAIRTLRARLGRSQAQCAAATGISAMDFDLLERGHRSPTAALLTSIADALDVTPDAFTGGQRAEIHPDNVRPALSHENHSGHTAHAAPIATEAPR